MLFHAISASQEAFSGPKSRRWRLLGCPRCCAPPSSWPWTCPWTRSASRPSCPPSAKRCQARPPAPQVSEPLGPVEPVEPVPALPEEVAEDQEHVKAWKATSSGGLRRWRCRSDCPAASGSRGASGHRRRWSRWLGGPESLHTKDNQFTIKKKKKDHNRLNRHVYNSIYSLFAGKPVVEVSIAYGRALRVPFPLPR